jgi:hypothetical protein
VKPGREAMLAYGANPEVPTAEGRMLAEAWCVDATEIRERPRGAPQQRPKRARAERRKVRDVFARG